jgi:hypothetical protein
MGAFQGTFGPNKRKYTCVDSGVGHINIEVINLNLSKSFDLNNSDCYDKLVHIIDNCRLVSTGPLSYSSHFDVSGWTFR